MREQVLVLLKGGWGYTFSHQTHCVGLAFVEKKIVRILTGTARNVFTWYSVSKVRAIIGKL